MQVPEGSKIISTTDERGFPKIELPLPPFQAMRIIAGIFLVGWLGGWGVGWVSAFKNLRHGATGGGGIEPFLLFWLVAWTAGGFAAAAFLLRLLRPAVPETLVLSASTIDYDTGIEPFRFDQAQMRQAIPFKMLFPKRRRVTLTLPQIRTLRLADNRLTVDIGIERREIGSALTEVEKEWFFALLKDKYAL